MKFKKLVTLMLTAAITVSALTACGDKQEQSNAGTSEKKEESSVAKEEKEQSEVKEESNEIVFPLEETMEFSMINMKNGSVFLADLPAWQELLEMTNTSFEHQEFDAEDVGEKTNLLLTGGDYADCLYRTGVDLEKYGMEGIVIPLEDLIREYAPNLTAELDARDLWGVLEAPDGHIYSMPCLHFISEANPTFKYNKNLLDNLGLEQPKNKEELYQALKAIKDQDADGDGDPNNEIPLIFASDWLTVSELATWLCGSEGLILTSDKMIFDKDSKEISFLPTTESFKEYLATCTQWYEEGLIYEDSFIKGWEQVCAMGQNGGHPYGFGFIPQDIYYAEEWTDYHAAMPFEDMAGIAMNNGVHKNGFGITDKCENPEVLVAMFDYLYTLDGSLMAWGGREGVDWERTEDGMIVFINETKAANGIQWGAYGPMKYTWDGFYADLESNRAPESRHWNEMCYGVYPEIGIELPNRIWPTEDAKSAYSDAWASIQPYVDNYVANVIIGETDLESTWDEFQTQLEAMGVDELVENYASAYAGYVALN